MGLDRKAVKCYNVYNNVVYNVARRDVFAVNIQIKRWKNGHIVTVWENSKWKYSVTAPLSFLRMVLRQHDRLLEFKDAVDKHDAGEAGSLNT